MFFARNQTECLSLNDEPCIIRPTLIDLNPVERKYYPFMISLDKCTGSCNVEAFDMITYKNEAKQWQSIFHVTANANSIVQHVIQIKNGIIKHVNVNVKIIVRAKKIIVGILAHVFVRIASI